MIATLPQLEYPRDWPEWTRVVGPLLWEPPGPAVEPPAGDGPVVLVAPSTSQDPQRTLLRAALEGLAEAPVRVLASWNGALDPSVPVPANAVVVPWMSYAATMPRCDLVLCHGGHGTLARALVSGCPVVIVPAGGDMGENAARVDRLGLGVRLPRRYGSPRGVRLAVEEALRRRRLRPNARAVARWAAAHDGPATAAAEIERWLDRRTAAP
jgi:UDP:flavonoid glycosyltransferase YjiC (YdhE family)